MTTVTNKGRELAYTLAKSIGFPPGAPQICSLICRHATSYERVQEAICNGHPACSSPTLDNATIQRLQGRHEAWCEKREQQLERRTTELAKELPGVTGVKFSGDPRGSTVKLTLANGRTDDWGQEGICVPGA